MQCARYRRVLTETAAPDANRPVRCSSAPVDKRCGLFMSHMFFTRIESVIPLSESPDSGLRENVHQQVRYFFLDRKSPSFAVSPRLTMLRLQSPYRKIHLSFRWCDLPLRPHHCQDQCHRNSNRHFGKPMKCDLTCKTR